MAVRQVKTVLTAEVSGFVGGMKRASAAAGDLATRTAALSKTAAWSWSKIGTGALLAGGVIAGGLGLAAKAAMDWESAWAGVTKTVDGSAAEMGVLEGQLRGLAKELPASTTEIAAVAEAAGQLGVRREDIAGFTRTMINLGETTNLSADEAATSLAQFMNIMGTAGSDVDRLGSTIVALGNDGASTEQDIVQMGQRIAGAARQVGMSETDVLGFASAIASTGINAEAGGTAISRAMTKIDSAVRGGGQGLADLARISGMTSDDFRQAWSTDSAGAMASVVEGLGQVQASGGQVRGELEKLGMTGMYEADVMSRLAAGTVAAGNAQNLLRDNLDSGRRAWQENNALTAEAEKRYQTTASQIRIATNVINDQAISLGAVLLPVIASTLTGVTSLVEGFGKLPEPVRQSIAVVGGLAAAALLAGGGLMKLATFVTTARITLEAMKISARTAGLAMGGVGVALAVAGIALSAWMEQSERAKQATESYTAALQASKGAIDESVAAQVALNLEQSGAVAAAQKLGISLDDVAAAAMGNADAMGRITAALAEVRNETEYRAGGSGQMLQTYTAEAEAARLLEGAIKGEGEALSSAVESQKRTEAATKAATKAQDGQTGSSKKLTRQIQEQEAATSELLEMTQQLGNKLLELSGSEIAVKEAAARAAETIRENGRTLNLNTEAGRANQKALNDLAAASMRQVQALVKNGASQQQVTAAANTARNAWITQARAANMSEAQIKSLSAQLFAVPPVTKSDVSTPGATYSAAQVQALKNRINEVPASKRTAFAAAIASGQYANAESMLNSLARTRYTTIVVNTVRTGVTSATGLVTASANAAGNLYEPHVAQIARPGAWRVWAEPETGGEAYIPLADDWRRPRAISIWEETGRRLGVMLAAGGILDGRNIGPAPAGTSRQDTVTALAPLMARIVTAADMRDVMRQLVHEIRQAPVGAPAAVRVI